MPKESKRQKKNRQNCVASNKSPQSTTMLRTNSSRSHTRSTISCDLGNGPVQALLAFVISPETPSANQLQLGCSSSCYSRSLDNSRSHERVSTSSKCSLSRPSFLRAGAGDPKSSSSSRTGRTDDGNVVRGHFQDPARQLTSPACGRAIL
jgi:hypothetical protein